MPTIESNSIKQSAPREISGFEAYEKLVASTKYAKAAMNGENLQALLTAKKEIFQNLEYLRNHTIDLSLDSRVSLAISGIHKDESTYRDLPLEVLGNKDVPGQLKRRARFTMHELSLRIAEIATPADGAKSATPQETVDDFGYKA